MIRHKTFLLGLTVAGLATVGYAQQPAPLKVETVTPRLHVILTMGNVTVFEGQEGLLVVDSSQASAAEALAAKVREISPKPVRYLVNTHYHFDHVGGNATLGRGATIVAQEACRKSALRDLKPEQKPEDVGVPQETYTDERELRLGKDVIKLVHLGPGHSAGDTVVVFESEKTLVAGDLFFNGLPPYIDVKDGADTANWAATIAKLAARYPDYKVVPGHGAVSDMKSWQRYAAYLTALRTKVAAAIQAGQTREAAVASIRLDEFPEVRGNELIKTANAVGWVYDELKR
jgi:glyoxylase-like metal-dependent hydrolase (beta-lactamase superfamily II)